MQKGFRVETKVRAEPEAEAGRGLRGQADACPGTKAASFGLGFRVQGPCGLTDGRMCMGLGRDDRGRADLASPQAQ